MKNRIELRLKELRSSAVGLSFMLLLGFCPSIFAIEITLDPNKTYQEQSCHVIVAQLENVGDIIEQLKPGVTPEQMKPIRKRIGNIRQFFDYYVYAYPLSEDGHDYWSEYRGLLDEAYGIFGDYKDLFDMQESGRDIKNREVEERWEAVVGWVGRYEQQVQLDLLEEYFSNSQDVARGVPGRKLPKLLWRLTDYVPNPLDLDRQVVFKLEADLAKDIETHLDKFFKLKKFYKKHKKEVLFHDIRKKVRLTFKLKTVLFPEYYAGELNLVANNNFLEKFVSKMGNVHDLVMAYHDEDDRDKKKDLAQQIDDDWKSIKDEYKDELQRVISTLRGHLIQITLPQ